MPVLPPDEDERKAAIEGAKDTLRRAGFLILGDDEPEEAAVKTEAATEKKKVHVADLRTSPRLQKMFRFLYERSKRPAKHGRPGATGGAIIWRTRLVGISAAIFELRHKNNGRFKIACVFERRIRNGSHIWRFTLDTNFTKDQRRRLDWLFNPPAKKRSR